MAIRLFAVVVLASRADALLVGHRLVQTPLTALNMKDSCVEISEGPLGKTFACDEPQGLGSEVELIDGELKWVRHPSLPNAGLSDMDEDACHLIGSSGKLFACKGDRPANGINCEQEWVEGEMVWVCKMP